MAVLDFVGTIEDDEEVPMLDVAEADDEEAHEDASTPSEAGATSMTTVKVPKKKGKGGKSKAKSDASPIALNPDFTFSMEGTPLDDLKAYGKGNRAVWDFDRVKEQMRRPSDNVRPLTSIDDKISKRRKVVAEGQAEDGKEQAGDVNAKDEGSASENDSDDATSASSDVASDAASDDDDIEPADRIKDRRSHARRATDENNSYFAAAADLPDEEECTFEAFTDMNLSRPILKGLTDVGFVKPTRIQAMTVPIALMGKDICGGAVTGSGKTAAFLVPMLERLLYRPKSAAPTSRVLILTPTRELAAQCYSVAVKLAKYTDITFCLCVGGTSTQQQESELRKRPDVVIATPGRLIDHVRNSQSFGLDSIEILVLDEADRMLEEGFQAELTEIIKQCPRNRQTLLFSATMTDNVDQLVTLSLNKPARLFIDAKNAVAHKLTQEFIRVRGPTSGETQSTSGAANAAKGIIDAATFDQREAILLALCTRTYTRRVIVFLPSKLECHRLKIIFGLHGISAAELHGNLSQLQRIESLEQFRDGSVDMLLATDLAARGLDITGVETVINFQMPPTYERYVHRVGRTARYERSGRAVTLVGEQDRKLVKVAVKNLKAGQSVKQRVIPAEVINKYRQKIKEVEEQVREVLIDEKDEKMLRNVEMSLHKAENMLKHESEILARPARTWFQSETERQNAKQLFQQLAQPADKATLGGNGDDDDQFGSDAEAAGSSSFDINAELAKELAKPFKRGADAGMSRKQRRKRELDREAEEDAGDHAKQQAQTSVAVKKAKRQARSFVVEQGMPASKMNSRDKMRKKQQKKKTAGVGMRFDREMTEGSKKGIVGGRSGRKVAPSGGAGKKGGRR